MREFYASRDHPTSTSQRRSSPRRVRSSARVPKTRAGLEAKSCGKLRPVGACPARRGHYGARPTVSRESSGNLRTLYSRIHVSIGGCLLWTASPVILRPQRGRVLCGETLSCCLLRPLSGLFLRVVRLAHRQPGDLTSVPGAVPKRCTQFFGWRALRRPGQRRRLVDGCFGGVRTTMASTPCSSRQS
jgi:hypothetical protein